MQCTNLDWILIFLNKNQLEKTLLEQLVKFLIWTLSYSVVSMLNFLNKIMALWLCKSTFFSKEMKNLEIHYQISATNLQVVQEKSYTYREEEREANITTGKYK